MQITEVTEDLALLLPIVILVEGIVGVVAWFAFGSKGGRGARVAAWLGLVTLTLWVGSAAAFVLLHVLLFTFGTWAAVLGAIAVTVLMVLMPFGWAVVIRHRDRDDTGNEPKLTGGPMVTRDAPADVATGTRLRVLLAIGQFPMLSSAFHTVIGRERDMQLVGDASGVERVVELARETGADVIVTECEPFGGAGCASFEAIETIRAACPELRVLALDCRCAAEQYSVALKAGASGYLTREATETDVLTALRSVAAGHTYVSPAIVTRMIDAYVRHSPDAVADDPYENLTPREREVLLLAAMGHTNRDIARSLHLSEQTVHSHRASVMEKLGLHDRVELLRYSVRRGILSPATL